MEKSRLVKVKMLGCLHTLRKQDGLPSVIDVDIPDEGRTARALAEDLALPVERIEAVICNHRARPLDHRILPGDTIAFLPHGTPGPHRYTLGIYSAGKGVGSSE